jgi:RHS repeat-associated protein
VPQNKNAEQINPGFTGLFYDHANNIYLTATRAYQPEQARFLQMDPLKQVPTESQKVLSAFVYCGNDPVNFMDLIGTQSEEVETIKEFYRIKNVMQDFVRDQWVMDYPNEIIPGYLKCYQWQNRTYDILNHMDLKHYDVIRYEAAIPLLFEKSYVYHYFVVLKDKRTGELHKIDPWKQPDFTYKYRDAGAVSAFNRKDLEDGSAGIPLPFKPTILDEESNYMQVEPGYDKFQKNVYNLIKRFDKSYTNSLQINNKYNNYQSPKNEYHNYDDDITKKLKPINYYSGGGGPGGPDGGAPGGGSWGSGFGGGYHPSTPSNVGGVHLKGAGSAFESIQSLSGIALDEATGKIILLSEEDTKVDIPTLRLDDVVTIFRCVYEQGEAPYVSIDPNPEDPEGPIMLSRHGKETENTYVGWILFETDRVMKAYRMGQDNITNQPLTTSIDGYQEVSEAKFDIIPGKQRWERFWIVPAEVNKKQTQSKELTLYDIPLKVKTEKMILRNGKMETDPVGKSSKGAEMFYEMVHPKL